MLASFHRLFQHTRHHGTTRERDGQAPSLASATRVANAFPDKLTSDLDALRGRPPVVPAVPILVHPKTILSSPLLFLSSLPPTGDSDPPPGEAERTTTPLLLAAAKLVNRVS